MTSRPAVGLPLAARLSLLASVALSIPPVVPGQATPDKGQVREIAITFDDLPAVSVAKGDPLSLASFTDKLLAHFTANKVPEGRR